MKEKVLAILRELFDDMTIDETCSQKTYEKWDSMAQLNLVIELETEFGITLEPEEIGLMTSFYDIVNILRTKI